MTIMGQFRIYLSGMLIFVASFFSGAQINTDQVLRVGQNALYFEDYVLSIQYFNQVIQAKPYLAQPYFMRAIAKLNLEDYSGAEADASKAIELNPFLPDAWEVRGVARQNLGKNDEAVADYDKALEQLPRNRQIMFNKALAQSDLKDYEAADSTFASLLRYYPGFDNGYLGRAKLRLAEADTTSAMEDIDHALEINKNALNGYIMRADIAIHRSRDYENALADMDEAVKLQPRYAGLYINRAFLRYNLSDYFGAMADYDYAIQLEPYNQVALFNRGLLLAEVNANDRALEDFSKVVELDNDDYRALYNRAMIYKNKRDFDAGISDINRVIEAFPDFPGAYYLRSELYREKGDMRRAERDYKKSMALAEAAKPADNSVSGSGATDVSGENGGSTDEIPEELVSKRFATLLTIDNNTDIQEEYHNSAIRGKVQDRAVSIEIEPMMELSYYSSPTQLRQNTYYIKEVDDLNGTRMLRFVMVVTNRPPQLTEEDMISRHFQSIEYYNSYLATHTPRTVDYMGRAMDFVTVRNYTSAIQDLDRAVALSPDYALAYYLRAQARHRQFEIRKSQPGEDEEHVEAITRAQLEKKALGDILDDINKAIELSPRMAMAWFNKGNVLVELGDYTSAISAYAHAIELQPDMGEAYYNRGYIYLKLGNRPAGIAELSKAGEYGIVPAYNLIKRISR